MFDLLIYMFENYLISKNNLDFDNKDTDLLTILVSKVL